MCSLARSAKLDEARNEMEHIFAVIGRIGGIDFEKYKDVLFKQ